MTYCSNKTRHFVTLIRKCLSDAEVSLDAPHFGHKYIEMVNYISVSTVK